MKKGETAFFREETKICSHFPFYRKKTKFESNYSKNYAKNTNDDKNFQNLNRKNAFKTKQITSECCDT